LLKLSNYDGAIASFSTIRQGFPSSKLVDDATYALGLAYFQKQDYRLSKEIFKNFEQEFADSNLKAQALYLLGTSYYNLGEFSDAIEVFKKIVRLSGNDTELVQKAEYEIADCFYQMGNEKEALARFNALRAKYPDSNLTAEIMWWLGEYYYRANDLQLALRHFSSLIRDFPDSPVIPDAYYALGAVYAQESKFDEAIAYFNKVIDASSSDLAGQAAIAIADILVRQGQPERAIELYKDKVRQYPHLAHLIYPKIGDIVSRAGNNQEALEYYQKSLDVVPLQELAEIRFKIAEAYQAQGKSDSAVEEYLKVTYLFPDNKELGVKAYLRVAKLYEDKEDLRAAEEVYKKLSLLNVPEAKYAQERLEAIRTQLKAR
jgi:TolA-binding protein